MLISRTWYSALGYGCHHPVAWTRYHLSEAVVGGASPKAWSAI